MYELLTCARQESYDSRHVCLAGNSLLCLHAAKEKVQLTRYEQQLHVQQENTSAEETTASQQHHAEVWAATASYTMPAPCSNAAQMMVTPDGMSVGLVAAPSGMFCVCSDKPCTWLAHCTIC